MKSIIFLLLLFWTLSGLPGFAQEYGWTNIGTNLPNTPSTATISDIAMHGDTMWVTSGYGTYLNGVPGEIYYSTDRGKTFTIQSTLYGTHAICMRDALHGWCGGVEGQIYYTDNGGAAWQRKFSLGRTLMDIDFADGADTGMCVGFTGGVKQVGLAGLVTVDMQGYVSNIYSVSCIDRHHAFVAGEEIIGPIIDGVLQIDQSYPGTNGIYAIDMVDTLYGWCVGSPTAAGSFDSAGCMIIRTTDGHNWVEQVNPVKGKYGTLMAVKALNRQEAWTVGTSGVILHTADGGETWKREAEGLTQEMLYGIHVVNNHEVYVTGNNRTLLKYGQVNGVGENPGSIRFSLSPNPATDHVAVTSSRPVNRVEVLDITGSLVFEADVMGTTSFNLDFGSLPAGTYFCKVRGDHANGVRKMVIK